MTDIETKANELADMVRRLPVVDAVAALNLVRGILHDASPLANEPVDHVLWVPSERVLANGYNPNHVAAVEMDLLTRSIKIDGFTQPIVGWPVSGDYEIVDGFHRGKVGREDEEIHQRLHGFLPLTVISPTRMELDDRMATTIRHNRARGRHKVGSMTDIVAELSRRGWSEKKIAGELGMDADEVLRLKQTTGLAQLFADREFSQAWDIEVDETT